MSELYDILKASADSTGLPVMNSSQFISITGKYGKKEFIKRKCFIICRCVI